MKLSQLSTDFLTDQREQSRIAGDYKTSDAIRDELDSRGSFCFDTKNGQVVYHLGTGYTREYVKNNLIEIDNKFKKFA